MKDTYNVIGVMSGTSLDGIDLCFTSFSKKNRDWKFSIHCCQTIKYDKKWVETLSLAHKFSVLEINEINKKYTSYLGDIILEFISNNNLNDIDLISSHGHTIFHQPFNNYTFQLGNLSTLRDITKITVVCDFRVQDVKYGGQGAPLVPIGDLYLFDSYSHCINLGGFSNISVKKKSQIIAYDICAVNIVLNHYSSKVGLDFDIDGQLSSSGVINYDLLSDLNSIYYYDLDYPKSLGVEWVEKNLFPLINSFEISTQDIMRTYVEHISVQISKNINDKKANILLTGGGAKNKFLISKLKERIDSKFQLESNEIIDFKEALIFGFLGVLKLRNENNCLKSVTGAYKDHSSGVIFR